MDPLTLTAQLNALLKATHLPFVLETPVDLTPSLLLAILESILNVRIPIAHGNDEDDKTQVVDGHVTLLQNRHVQTIKIFLGVLETDILQTDVGLSKLDPRLLAAGAWDEVVYVAEVLCWIGEELGLIMPAPVSDKGKGRTQEPHPEHSTQSTDGLVPYGVKAPSPSPSSTITFLPPFAEASPPPTPTTTALLFATDAEDTLQTNITSPLATSSPLRQLPNPSTYHNPLKPQSNSHLMSPTRLSSPSISTPTRIHSRSHSHSSFSASIRDIPPDDSSFIRLTPPIRRTGYISLVDHDTELSSFLAHSLSPSTSSPSSPSLTHHASQRRAQSKPKPRHRPSAAPTHPPTSPPQASTHPRRSDVESQDWRTLLSTSPNYDPRRTYDLLQQRTELMEELLRIRMSRRRPFR